MHLGLGRFRCGGLNGGRAFVLHHMCYRAEKEDSDDLTDNVPIDLGVWIFGLSW